MTQYARLIAPIVALWLGLFPLSSEAWFFNVAKAQSDSPVQTPSNDNAQTVDLLSPSIAMNDDRSAVDADADIVIDSGEALEPMIGASGTLADITESSDAASIQTYIVQPGDSVAAIAKRFGVSENTIRWANDLKKTDVVHRGDLLIILPVSGVKYTVKKGDNLAAIEKRFKLSSDDINAFLDYNGLEQSDPLTIGQELIIPGAEFQTAPASSSTSKSKSGTKSNFIWKGTTAGIGSTALMIHTPIVSQIVRDYFIKPVPCPMSQGRHDLYAVDLSCHTSGTPIKAAADGVIMFAKYGYNGGYGNLIIMKHPNGMLTFYAHIKDGGINVRQGQSVSQGTVIAYVGSTGRSTGAHLHFEVRGGGNPGFDYSGSAWKK